jgi:eukaryotic-like serine/threonine-protein kinase
MSVGRGTRLGPYELLEPLGSGGMGEVWRARDAKLARDVALKIIPAELAESRERRRRFEHEARAASALNHPNIVTVYDIGEADGTPYMAMELVAGKTLREICQTGPLPARKLLDAAVAIADGLARAHAAAIVHRDLKPENIMVTPDGVVKILDFGLAKLVRSPVDPETGERSTATVGTEPGILLGTYGYMSPEQASGKPVDFRSDQFSFGSILYEMATGVRAFRRDSAVDTLSAVLHEEPDPIAKINEKAPAPLRWIVERCHAKDPKDRYASTEDLARELRSVREHLSEISAVGSLAGLEEPAPPSRRWIRVGAAVLAAVLLLVAGLWLGRSGRPRPPKITQLTSQSGAITTARFTPDGQSVVYATQWEGKRPELFETRLDHPESRSLGLPSAQVLSISRSGFLAIGLLPSHGMTLRSPSYDLTDRFPLLLFGTLAQVPLAGGAPRELLENVSEADWAPNGRDLAVVRFVDGGNRLEYPVGKRLFNHFGWITFPRVSPDGERVAFSRVDASLFLADRSGRLTDLKTTAWEHVWSPVTSEILYLDFDNGTSRLRSVSVNARNRLLATLAGYFTIYDVSSSGAVLLGQVIGSDEVFGSFPGEPRDRRLFDNARLEDVSAAGDLVTFTAAAFDDTAYLGSTDGAPPKRLGSLGGFAGAVLTSDGKYVAGQISSDGLVVLDAEETSLVLVPTGAGQPIQVPTRGLSNPSAQGVSRDGKQVYLIGTEPGHLPRLWIQDLASGQRHSVTPEGVYRPRVSPDGKYAVAFRESAWSLFPADSGDPRSVAGVLPGEEPFQWTADGRQLYVRAADELHPGDKVIVSRVYRLDPWTGRRELWKEIPPLSPSTGGGVGNIRFSADGKICFYTHHRISAELFLAEGLK